MARNTFRWLTAILLGTAFHALIACPAQAEVPSLIRYQGQAADTNGVPLEGPYTLTFRLYNAETAGTKLWEEPQQNVPLSGGHFSVLLGSVTSLAALDWAAPCWLSVQVNGESELAPRQRITSVPLALRAKTAEQLATPVTTSTITDDGNRLIPPGAIILWEGASCPTGYTRLSSYDGKFLVASNASGATGGSNNHSHAASGYTDTDGAHRHGMAQISMSNRMFGNDNDDDTFQPSESGSAHAHHFSATTNTIDSRPEFKTILLCKKD